MNMTDYIAVLRGTDTWVSTPPPACTGSDDRTSLDFHG